MRNDNCPDCSRLTSGDCGKHSGTYFEPTAKSINQFKQEVIHQLEMLVIVENNNDYIAGLNKAIEIIKNK